MPIHIDVIFTGLALFCLNEGSMCTTDVVYLMNGGENAQVCGHQVDGGHEPVLSFDARHLLPGSPHPHQIVRTERQAEYVFASLEGVDLCICLEDATLAGCPAPGEGAEGAKPLMESMPAKRKDPQIPWEDERGFQWVPKLANLHEEAKDVKLCPQVNGPLTPSPGHLNPLVSARVHLDEGIVKTGYGWHEEWGWIVWRLLRRLTENDFSIWSAGQAPGDSTELSQTHFPKALPGHATWTIPDLGEKDVILLNECSDRDNQRTLFRLTSNRGNLRLYVNNGPHHKSPLMPKTPLEHFWWYYRAVDWENDTCPQLNQEKDDCPDGLAFPYLPADAKVFSQEKSLKPVLTVGDKCPPLNAG